VLESTLRDPAGKAIENVEQSTPIAFDVLIEAARSLNEPKFVFHIMNEGGVVISAFTVALEKSVATGQRVRLRGRIDNPLVAGRYYLDCWVRQDERDSMMLQPIRLLQFIVYGTAPRFGVVTLKAELEVAPEEPPQR